MGASNALVYSRIENDPENPDFITGNQISRKGIIENTKAFGSTSILSLDKASAAYALKLVGAGYSSATFTPDSIITQKTGTGVTAIGRVLGYDQVTGVLKYWQDRNQAGFTTVGLGTTSPIYGFNADRFTSDISDGGSFSVVPDDG